MKIVASLIVKNELGRLLEPCIDSLLEFCDEVCDLDDGSDDGTRAWLADRRGRIVSLCGEPDSFFRHEGRARQRLLEWTIQAEPTHILSIDADELVTDGLAIRKACESSHEVFALGIAEAWEATEDGICVRVDGGWRPHSINALWRVPQPFDARRWRINDRALACGRVPVQVDRGRAHWLEAEILHFGWSNEAERVARHRRYAVADGGRFHRSQHLDSILNPCERVQLERMGWPAGLLPYRDAILAKVTSNESPTVPT
jgi:glycosyltransferase involved in cell wall biosynthesis